MYDKHLVNRAGNTLAESKRIADMLGWKLQLPRPILIACKDNSICPRTWVDWSLQKRNRKRFVELGRLYSLATNIRNSLFEFSYKSFYFGEALNSMWHPPLSKESLDDASEFYLSIANQIRLEAKLDKLLTEEFRYIVEAKRESTWELYVDYRKSPAGLNEAFLTVLKAQ